VDSTVSNLPRSDRWLGRYQCYPALGDIDFGIPIDRECQVKVVGEGCLEVVARAKPGAELALECGPAHRRRTLEGMEPIGEPSIKIQAHAVIANGTDRCVFERYRVALQFIKKPLGEVRRFEKQRTLCAISSV
jgi:hypothetical protein